MDLTFTVTRQEADLILASLGKQPAEAVMGVIIKLQQQAAEQLKPKPEPEPAKE